MRPQFHHIDAQTELERISKAKESGFAGAPREARAVHMTIKTNIDGEEESGNSMAERISTAQAEPWKHHRYIDENHDDAWALYDEMSVGKDLKQDERLEKMPKLKSCLDDGEYLDLISGPRDAARLSRSKKKKEKRVRQNAVIGDDNADAEAGGDSSSTLSDLSGEDEAEL
jgi:DNA-directed RNA polymerase-3 subunit RPC5